ncbi:hypothetical protein Hypma_014466 [Hypsizygus marmoreus]|uniref:Uncharacterized protein n=1 Tax=Hypsizygus marmoreus TaxID=39966 RepID=A0A369JAV5_HYPMA|nr:hypothetical protein Hypma_014466 [Hypsizygus marmoreus]
MKAPIVSRPPSPFLPLVALTVDRGIRRLSCESTIFVTGLPGRSQWEKRIEGMMYCSFHAPNGPQCASCIAAGVTRGHKTPGRLAPVCDANEQPAHLSKCLSKHRSFAAPSLPLSREISLRISCIQHHVDSPPLSRSYVLISRFSSNLDVRGKSLITDGAIQSPHVPQDVTQQSHPT